MEGFVPIPQKVAGRIITQIKRYQQILAVAKDRDISKSDTVSIITDMPMHVLSKRSKFHNGKSGFNSPYATTKSTEEEQKI
jgi:hypothetical protein